MNTITTSAENHATARSAPTFSDPEEREARALLDDLRSRSRSSLAGLIATMDEFD